VMRATSMLIKIKIVLKQKISTISAH